MTYSAKNSTGEVKTYIVDMSESVVDVVAEQIQKEHIAEDVQKAAVQKGIAYELPQMRPGGRKDKLIGPGPEYADRLIRLAAGRPKSQ